MSKKILAEFEADLVDEAVALAQHTAKTGDCLQTREQLIADNVVLASEVLRLRGELAALAARVERHLLGSTIPVSIYARPRRKDVHGNNLRKMRMVAKLANLEKSQS